MTLLHPRSLSTRHPGQLTFWPAVPWAPRLGHRRSGLGAGLLALWLGVGAAGCDGGGSSPAPAAASTSEAEAAERVWARSCASCHQRHEKQGRNAAQIRQALRDVPSMRPYASRLSDADIDGLVLLLAPDSGAASAP